jgi:hypothetical protein
MLDYFKDEIGRGAAVELYEIWIYQVVVPIEIAILNRQREDGGIQLFVDLFGHGAEMGARCGDYCNTIIP